MASSYRTDRKWNRDSQPVAGVSWYEAEAYCNWLNLAQQGQRYKPRDMTAQLPTQAQWLLAAWNGQVAPHDDRQDYPWGGAFDNALGNTSESNMRQTTPVDMYPDGATPSGVYDMAGNVWEWMVDAHNKDRTRFWVKGGSWAYDATVSRALAVCHFACDTAPVVCSNGAPAICGNGAPLAGDDLAK